MSDVYVPNKGDRGRFHEYLPSPEEIRKECAKIRAGWTDAEREKRYVGRKPFEFPVLKGYSL